MLLLQHRGPRMAARRKAGRAVAPHPAAQAVLPSARSRRRACTWGKPVFRQSCAPRPRPRARRAQSAAVSRALVAFPRGRDRAASFKVVPAAGECGVTQPAAPFRCDTSAAPDRRVTRRWRQVIDACLVERMGRKARRQQHAGPSSGTGRPRPIGGRKMRAESEKQRLCRRSVATALGGNAAEPIR